jgi:hypothetical protein
MRLGPERLANGGECQERRQILWFFKERTVAGGCPLGDGSLGVRLIPPKGHPPQQSSLRADKMCH